MSLRSAMLHKLDVVVVLVLASLSANRYARSHSSSHLATEEHDRRYDIKEFVEEEGLTFSLLEVDSLRYRNLVERFNEVKVNCMREQRSCWC